MEKVYRVFFHELGHFIGRQINLRKYGGPDVMEIKIFPCRKKPDEYCGHTRPIIPLGIDLRKPMLRERVPSYLASIPYGCFIQAYYTDKSLNFCFKEHGEDDEEKYEWNMKCQGLKFKLEDFRNINYPFFDQLKATNAFDALMKINPNDYLQDESRGKFGVDIDKLKADIEPFLDSHILVYTQLVDQYEALIRM